MRAALRDLENAKQDITTFFNGAGINLGQKNELTVDKYHEILPGERLKPYQILYSTIGLANNLSKIDNDAAIEKFNHECDTFDICSIIGLSLLLEYAAEMTEQACQRIVKFTLKTEVKEVYEMADSVLDRIGNFFNFTISASYRTPEHNEEKLMHMPSCRYAFFQNFQKE
ncbi:unnamed protein product [Rotaria magnacalcarata]|uniref:Uncharacterized protein n=1 Tax=Rotaria magnacalcarata TaxID=392030 RepID=A0A816Z6K8_9BILA|nr:unnamed protein product [Rotaria magnacalcarata]